MKPYTILSSAERKEIKTSILEYVCESGEIGRVTIPQDATQGDLEGIKKMLDVVIKLHQKKKEREQK